MGLYTNISPALEEKVVEVSKKKISNICTIQTKIYSDNDDQLVVKPKLVKTFNISHNFDASYHEKITATFQVSMEEALYILSNDQDLRVTIILTHVTQHYYRPVPNVDPEIYQFRGILLGKDDLKKTMQKVEIMADTEKNSDGSSKYTPEQIRAMKFDLQMELMDEVIYEFSKRPLNGLLKDVSMEDTVHFLANALGIQKVQMTTPDNPTKYKHVILNPMVTLEVIDRLQETYGIYQKGIGYYYFNDTLYVYPEYELDAQSDAEIHFWRLPVNSYPGSSSYSSVEDNVLKILLTENAEFRSLSEVGTEQLGNFQITKRTDTQLDVDTQQNGISATVRQNNLYSVAPENEKTATTGKVSARYNGVSNNPLAMSSEMARVMCSMMSTTWNMAWPWSIKPGSKVVYNYEEVSGLKTANGIIHSVEYALSAIEGVPTDQTLVRYAWAAAIVMRLELMLDEEQITPDMLSENTRRQLEYNRQS